MRLASEGRFAGHFFGWNYQGFDKHEMNVMSFLTKEEVVDLFQGFEI